MLSERLKIIKGTIHSLKLKLNDIKLEMTDINICPANILAANLTPKEIILAT